MKISSISFFTIMLVSFLFYGTNLTAQETQVLYPKNEAPIQGKLISMDEKTIVFQDLQGNSKTFERAVVDSIGTLQKVEEVIETNSLEVIQAANPTVEIAKNLSIDDLRQEHSITTNWGQKYAGIIVKISTEKLILTTQNGMDLPFKMTEIQKIEVIKMDLQPKNLTDKKERETQKSYKTITGPNSRSSAVRKQRQSERMADRRRKNTYIPYRIGITPTAFSLPNGQFLFRSSAAYLREFVYAGKYFHGAIGFSGTFTQARLHVGIPVKKYLHLGLSVEGTNSSNSNGANFAFAPIVTIGTPDYFINLVYKSESPVFLPSGGGNLVEFADYWSFGAGLRITDNFNFLTESALLKSDRFDFFNNREIREKYYRVYLGFSLNIDIQTIGGGLTFYDSETTTDRFSSETTNGRVFPSFQYTIRFR